MKGDNESVQPPNAVAFEDLPVRDWKENSEAFTDALSLLEAKYGERTYSKRVMEGVRDSIPWLLTQRGIISLALENALLKQDIEILRREKSRLVSVINLLWRDEATVETDPTWVIISISQKLLELSGYSEAELIGRNMSVFWSWVHDAGFWKWFWDTISSGNVWEGNVCERAKNGNLFWLHTVVSPVIENGKVVSFQVVSHDITELERLRHAQSDRAHSLINYQTGLPNRNQLVEDLKTKTVPTLAVVHVNHMIEVNNAYWPEMGDNVLIAVGWRLAWLFRSKGGEAYKLEWADFAVTCLENATPESIEQFISHLNGLEVEQEWVKIHLSFSVWIVSDGSNGKEMLMRAYIALHQSREMQEPAVLFDSNLLTSEFFRESLEMVSLVKLAIEKDLLVPFCQEIHENEPSLIPVKKFECLVRMKDPSDTHSVIAPWKFLFAAKKGGHLRAITRIMVEKTFCRFAWTGVQFSINLSADDVTDLTFVDFVRDSLSRYGVTPSDVIFEILEWVDTSKSELMVEIARGLKSLGCKIAIDDFWTENANLTRMIDFAADYIKIDMKYVRWIDANRRNESLLRHIIGYAHENGILVIAEWVETQAEQNVLVALGADYSQWYLFSRPVPLD